MKSIKQIKQEMNYRRSKISELQICLYCKHSHEKEYGTASGYHTAYKCDLIGLTCSSKTDIGKTCTCDKWEKREYKQ